jgi:hypothetical protein
LTYTYHQYKKTLQLRNVYVLWHLYISTYRPRWVEYRILKKSRDFFQTLFDQLRGFHSNHCQDREVNYTLALSTKKIRASNLEISPNYAVMILSLPSAVSDKYWSFSVLYLYYSTRTVDVLVQYESNTTSQYCCHQLLKYINIIQFFCYSFFFRYIDLNVIQF